MELIIGYSFALVIGIALGLIGGGGSILALPVLIYVFGLPAVEATAYSLFIVGITSAFGSLSASRKKNIDFKAVALFALPSLVSVFTVRKFLIPVLPESIVRIGSFDVTKDKFLLLIFSLLMVVAGVIMITGKCEHCDENEAKVKKINYLLIFSEGIIIGGITGLIGAGGGFLVIPALVMYAGLSMKKAVGTSLMIIAIKSLAGFMGDVLNLADIDWKLLAVFSSLAIAGTFVGQRLQSVISEKKLKKLVGIVILVVAFGILIKEMI